MAIEFFTGFEGCGSSDDVEAFFSYVYNLSDALYSATGGYANGKCLNISDSKTQYAVKNVTASKTKAVGMHINSIGTSGYSTTLLYHLMRFTIGTSYIRIFNTSGGVEVYRDSTLIASCAEVISSSLVHIEAKLFSNASTGTFQLKINGSLVIDASDLNTGGSDITSFVIGSTNDNAVYYDNIYIADDFQGELISYMLNPTSDVTSDFTPSAGSDNYAMVDDDAQDGDTTYVESSTVGHQDLYGYEDAPTNIDIKAVSIVTVMKEVDPGDRFVRHIANQDATEYDLTSFGLGSIYPSGGSLGLFEILNTCPDTTAWTPTKLNAISFGLEIVS